MSRESKSQHRVKPTASSQMTNSSGTGALPVGFAGYCCCQAGDLRSCCSHSPPKWTPDYCHRCALLAEHKQSSGGPDYQALARIDRTCAVPRGAGLTPAYGPASQGESPRPKVSRVAAGSSIMPTTRRRRHLIGSSTAGAAAQARLDSSAPVQPDDEQLPLATPATRYSVSSGSLSNVKLQEELMKLNELWLEGGKTPGVEQKSCGAAPCQEPNSCDSTPAPPQEAPGVTKEAAADSASTRRASRPSEYEIKVGGRNEGDAGEGKQEDKTAAPPTCRDAGPTGGETWSQTDERSADEQTRRRDLRKQDEHKPTQGDQSKAKGECANQSEFKHQPESRRQSHLAWNDLALKYGKMPTRKGQLGRPGPTRLPSNYSHDNSHSQQQLVGPGRSGRARLRDSCLCHVLAALLQTVFPIFGSFRNYSLPGDLITDFTAGFTVAVLHIPQGMAYGLLSGVEPIYGLYVSFIPVLVMSFMSKSRHASYGTFAIISMLLVNTIGQVRSTLREERAALSRGSVNSSHLVLTNNHQPAGAVGQPQDQLLRQLLQQSTDGIPGEPDRQRDFGPTSSRAQGLPGDPAVPDGPAAVAAVVATSMPTNIEILSCVCIVCGVVHVTMCLMRLGVLSLMFSDQLVSSFTTAGAVHVLTSQLAGLFDLSLPPISDELFKCSRVWWQFTRALVYDGFNQPTALLSLASVLFLLAVKEILEPLLRRRFTRLTCLPSELVLMSIVICCSRLYQFSTSFNIKIIGHVPTGLPEPRVPNLELVPYVLKDSISIALITFAMNLSIAQVYAKKFRYELDANQELFALGSANLISSFFNCFPCASSLSRSSVQSSLNVKSQLCSLFSCCIVVVIVCYFANVLHYLPKSTLSCIIVVALKGILLQIRDLYDNWRLSKLDALVWIFTFVSVIIFGVTFGLILGIVASLSMIFLRLLTPNHSVLGRLPGTEIYIDKEAFVECEELEHVKIFRFNSALCYLNRTMLKSKIEKLLPTVYEPTGFRAICSRFHLQQAAYNCAASDLGRRGTTCSESEKTYFLVVDCSALSYCDYSGAATLLELVDDLAERKVAVYLAACPLKLIDMLDKMQARPELLTQNVFPTISDAIGQIRYLQEACDKKTRSATSIAKQPTKPSAGKPYTRSSRPADMPR